MRRPLLLVILISVAILACWLMLGRRPDATATVDSRPRVATAAPAADAAAVPAPSATRAMPRPPPAAAPEPVPAAAPDAAPVAAAPASSVMPADAPVAPAVAEPGPRQPEEAAMPDDPLTAARRVAEAAERRDVPALVAALAHGNAQVRVQAIDALARIPGAEARVALTGALRDHDPGVIRAVAGALHGRAEREAGPALRDALAACAGRSDGFGPELGAVLAAAAAACGERGAVPELAAVLARSEPRSFTLAAVDALGQLGDPRAAPALRRYRDRLIAAEPRDPTFRHEWQDDLRRVDAALAALVR